MGSDSKREAAVYKDLLSRYPFYLCILIIVYLYICFLCICIFVLLLASRWEVIARERQLCTKTCLAVILSNIHPTSENKTNIVLS